MFAPDLLLGITIREYGLRAGFRVTPMSSLMPSRVFIENGTESFVLKYS